MVTSHFVWVRATNHPSVLFLAHAIVAHDEHTTAGEIQKRARTIAALVTNVSLGTARKET